MKTFIIEYIVPKETSRVQRGWVWKMGIDAEDRENALRLFRRDHPHGELRECWEKK